MKSGDVDTESPVPVFTDDGMLSASFDFLWGDWDAPDALFAGM